MKRTLKISNREITELLGGKTPTFPKYATQIINLANQNAGGTRPKVVGQMSELIQEFPGKTLEEWKKWYSKQKPDAIENAVEKILRHIKLLNETMELIDEASVHQWVEDLVFNKTFSGLLFQEAILKKVSEVLGKPYRRSTPDEEAKGIDGYIGGRPVTVKAHTFDYKKGSLRESLPEFLIQYEKKKDGLSITINE